MLEPLGIQVRSLLDLEEKVEIEETGTTFAENAMIKALSVHERLGIPVISDDSGLEVDAMDKAPGVYSARFLGYDTPYEEKNQYIMDQVKGKTRTARYVCAIAYAEQQTAPAMCSPAWWKERSRIMRAAKRDSVMIRSSIIRPMARRSLK